MNKISKEKILKKEIREAMEIEGTGEILYIKNPTVEQREEIKKMLLELDLNIKEEQIKLYQYMVNNLTNLDFEFSYELLEEENIVPEIELMFATFLEILLDIEKSMKAGLLANYYSGELGKSLEREKK